MSLTISYTSEVHLELIVTVQQFVVQLSLGFVAEHKHPCKKSLQVLSDVDSNIFVWYKLMGYYRDVEVVGLILFTVA